MAALGLVTGISMAKGLMGIITLFLVVMYLMNLTSHGVEAKKVVEQIEEDLELERELKILNVPPLKTIRTKEGDDLDCIDFYKQPSLSHPLLRDHKIQMKPTFFPKRDTNKTSSATEPMQIIFKHKKCPKGTIPIRRTSKEDLLRARAFSIEFITNVRRINRHFSGQYIADVNMELTNGPIRGASASINVYNPTVSDSQFTTGQIWINGGPNETPNYIMVGWTVNPILYRDHNTRFFTFWMVCFKSNLLSKLNTTPHIPPVTSVVSDGAMSFTLQAAEEIGVPEVLLWTTSACGFLAYLHYPHLMDRGFTPLKDASYLLNGYLDTPLDWIPGMNGIRLKDIPTFVRTTNPDDVMLNFVKGEVGRAYKASAIILNTFEILEKDVVDALSTMLPRVYTIGPLPLMLDQIKDDRLSSIGSNLWKEESECLEWLDSKEPSSVVYVNFGSITVMTPQQLVEFAWGLSNSNHTFLWIIRPDLVEGDSAVLPSEFVSQTKERGMLSSWCPQEKVLNHPAIGGFLTHSGWNSTLESICGGVPMVCWPFFADQQTNCRYSCTHWGIGTEMDNNVKRDEVEKLVRELMEGDKGKEMKTKAMVWKKKAEEATSPDGSSLLNFDNLVDEILLSNRLLP
ncbi:7-deoxyloganetin glucosyltransferase-like [Macadamia integrifolia]|uniref:7-deoxyloganetin glucosyltransferase-like n=1 Tax=Macadamia integrifolia TaxID=60698 RepID=UPI001C4EDAAB|nr:7-deoxyloganetin glucosyltransferase-like [Macadamia integrifolia]XP_042493622.1 7-deoxyloganetin glucosyltransferase-like [Macadamia integrifolia]